MSTPDPTARLRTIAAQHRDAAADMVLYERWDEALAHYARAVTMFADAHDERALLDVLFDAARAARLGRRPSELEKLLRRAADVARDAGFALDQARAVAHLAQARDEAGRPLEARRMWSEVLQLSSRIVPPESARTLVATAHGRLAELALTASDHASAATHLTAAATLAEAAGDYATLAALALSRGRLARQTGDLGGARAAFDEALQRFGELQDLARMADVLGQRGNLERDTGDLNAARQLFESSLVMAEAASDAVAAASALTNLANLDMARDDPDAARARYREVIDIATGIGHTETLLGALVNLANLEAAAFDTEAARTRYREALAVIRDLGAARLEVDVTMLLAQLDARDARFDAAAALIETARARAVAANHTLGVARLDVNRAAILHATGHVTQALAAYRAALTAFDSTRFPADAAVAAFALAECALAASELATARDAVAKAHETIRDSEQREALDAALVAARIDHAERPNGLTRKVLLELADRCDSKQRPNDALVARLTVADRLERTDPELAALFRQVSTLPLKRLETPTRLELASLQAWRDGDTNTLAALAAEARACSLVLVAIRIGRRLLDVTRATEAFDEAARARLEHEASTIGYHAERLRLAALAQSHAG
jgi:tetratricopeptide (TPR) repeat protein